MVIKGSYNDRYRAIAPTVQQSQSSSQSSVGNDTSIMMSRKFITVEFTTWHTKTSTRQRAGTGRHFQARPGPVRWHLVPYPVRPVKICKFQAQARPGLRAARPVQGSRLGAPAHIEHTIRCAMGNQCRYLRVAVTWPHGPRRATSRAAAFWHYTTQCNMFAYCIYCHNMCIVFYCEQITDIDDASLLLTRKIHDGFA